MAQDNSYGGDVETRELIVNAVKCVQVPMECAISRADCLETFVSTHQLSVVVMCPHYTWLNIGGESATKAYNLLLVIGHSCTSPPPPPTQIASQSVEQILQ